MANSKKPGRLLYVQLSREEIRLALAGGPDAPRRTLQTPPGAVQDGVIRNVEAICELLQAVLREPDFKGCRKVVFSLCTSQVIAETVTDVPANVSGKSLEKLLQTNADQYFPVMDMQEYQLVWQVIDFRDGGWQVQLWAVPLAMLRRYYQLANACGLQVVRIDYCGSSMAAAVGASFASYSKRGMNREAPAAHDAQRQPDTQLYVWLESDLLGITLVQERQVKLQRFLPCGADPAHQFDELAMIVEYYRSLEAGRGSAITGFVCGGLAENSAAVSELSHSLGLPLALWAGEAGTKWVLCAGAAASTLEFGVPMCNAGRAGCRMESQLWQYGLLLASSLVLVAVLLLSVTARRQWEAEANALEQQQQALLLQASQTAGCAEAYQQYIREYRQYAADWDTIFDNLHTYNDYLVFALQELEDALPMQTSVQALQIAADGLTATVTCGTKEEAACLIRALRDMKYMEVAHISNLVDGDGDDCSLTVTLRYTQALLEIAQERNGLDEDAKLEQVEVPDA